MPDAAGPPVIAERDGGVGVARLDRPGTRNALTPDLMEALAGTLEAWDADPEVRCMVVAGTKEVFASGGDLDPPGAARVGELWRRLAAPGKPVVAAVSGYALGSGWELALLCDMVVASENAEFGQPEILLGLLPGGGATQRLARTIGRQRAMELVLTGRRIDAAEALRLGLLNQVTGKRDWLERAIELAKVVASRPPVAARLAKRAILAAEELGLTDALAEERRLHEQAMATEDRAEGVQALREGRAPRFTGR